MSWLWRALNVRLRQWESTESFWGNSVSADWNGVMKEEDYYPV